MNILVFSDIHDHLKNLEQVIEQTRDLVEAAIYCGDMCAPFTAREVAKLNRPIYACLGNVDEDHIAMQQLGGDAITWTPLAREFGEVELGGRKIAFVHYTRIAELLAQSSEYDAVFHGHTHVVREERLGESVLVNPGAVCGIVKGKYTVPSYALYDTETNSVEIKKLL